ncbi:hypothetical protein [Nonomuraea typhae]|uniref:YbaB/EbfC family DNA-binding protein n=1 Tax=Nonomuraea typhae TaxID=2603600 RepID=A0ABW7YWS2_9ACTN
MDDMHLMQARLDELIAAGERAETLVEEWNTRRHTAGADHGRIVAVTDALGTLVSLDISPLSRRNLDAVQMADALMKAISGAEEAAAAAHADLMDGLRS